jgi:hypothetical protein
VSGAGDRSRLSHSPSGDSRSTAVLDRGAMFSDNFRVGRRWERTLLEASQNIWGACGRYCWSDGLFSPGIVSLARRRLRNTEAGSSFSEWRVIRPES